MFNAHSIPLPLYKLDCGKKIKDYFKENIKCYAYMQQAT